MSPNIHDSMQAVQLDKDAGPLAIRDIPVPRPGPDEVLIRMAGSWPINPSDLGFIEGGHGYEKTFPVIPGVEGQRDGYCWRVGSLVEIPTGKRRCLRQIADGGQFPGPSIWSHTLPYVCP